ncbi:heterokaryon incompatibility protein-domain-containing protein [Aspergillus transmontanensis]|uniref:Heterokaryon incompatibility protein-domain-containing protein n=1 Tax=Aspergillus transmontanensis TaxID=1034304 RepID=A0A5N6WAY1_9EURO|nr:heterokaryon incompatibility protein-domain-containing protein [Aspergillus transmontanensis]
MRKPFSRLSSSAPECPHSPFRADVNCSGLYYRPISAFVENASRCADCSILLQAVEVIKPGWVRENNKHGLVNIGRERADDDWNLVVPTMTLGIRPPSEPRDPFSNELQHSFSFHLLQLSTSAVYESPDSRTLGFAGWNLSQSLEVNEDSGSSAAFNRARQWLSHCVQHDQACKPPDTEFMPRRLVNIGSWEGSQEPFLFEPTTPVPYACLSYCWGIDIDRVMKTTTDNIHSHYQRLELATLPAAIQDAIVVCRALKIPNLWVDSLCIIQDDKVAWLHDASTMHDVYRNSHLTIAVMEPNSCKLRFLGKQQFGDPSWQRLFCPTLPDLPEDTSTELLMRPGEFKPRSNTERSSLDKRGWCLQESLLPNRRLCYDGKEMIWECLCRQVCECGHVVEPQIPYDTSKDYGKLGTTLKTHLPEAEPPFDRMNGFLFRHCSPPMIPYFGWRDLVTDYSHRSLSKRYDALRAISALAKMVRNRLPEKDGLLDEYVAGLWKGELHFDLTWEVKPVDAHDVPPSTGLEDDNETSYRIPSWSWASVGKPITYSFTEAFRIWKYEPEAIDICQIKVIDCKREVPEDPTSAVIGGSLVLQGAFAPVQLVSDNERKVAYVQSTGVQTLPISLDSPALVANGDDQYYCFRLFTLVGYNYGRFRMGPETRFLVLKRSTYKEGAFERIGVGVWDDNFGEKKPCPLFVDVESAAVEMV